MISGRGADSPCTLLRFTLIGWGHCLEAPWPCSRTSPAASSRGTTCCGPNGRDLPRAVCCPLGSSVGLVPSGLIMGRSVGVCCGSRFSYRSEAPPHLPRSGGFFVPRTDPRPADSTGCVLYASHCVECRDLSAIVQPLSPPVRLRSACCGERRSRAVPVAVPRVVRPALDAVWNTPRTRSSSVEQRTLHPSAVGSIPTEFPSREAPPVASGRPSSVPAVPLAGLHVRNPRFAAPRSASHPGSPTSRRGGLGRDPPQGRRARGGSAGRGPCIALPEPHSSVSSGRRADSRRR